MVAVWILHVFAAGGRINRYRHDTIRHANTKLNCNEPRGFRRRAACRGATCDVGSGPSSFANNGPWRLRCEYPELPLLPPIMAGAGSTLPVCIGTMSSRVHRGLLSKPRLSIVPRIDPVLVVLLGMQNQTATLIVPLKRGRLAF